MVNEPNVFVSLEVHLSKCNYLRFYNLVLFPEALRAYFTSPTMIGLMTKDIIWIEQIRNFLMRQGLSRQDAETVRYANDDIQGWNYVSLAFPESLQDWFKKLAERKRNEDLSGDDGTAG